MFHVVENWLIHSCIDIPDSLTENQVQHALERAVHSLCFLNVTINHSMLLPYADLQLYPFSSILYCCCLFLW